MLFSCSLYRGSYIPLWTLNRLLAAISNQCPACNNKAGFTEIFDTETGKVNHTLHACSFTDSLFHIDGVVYSQPCLLGLKLSNCNCLSQEAVRIYPGARRGSGYIIGHVFLYLRLLFTHDYPQRSSAYLEPLFAQPLSIKDITNNVATFVATIATIATIYTMPSQFIGNAN